MALYRDDIVDIELNSGTLTRSFMIHTIGEGDALANRFGVHVLRNGQEVNLAGTTCSGFFVRSDGGTIPIAGTVSGSTAYVVLDSSCYAVEGQFALAIKLMDGSVTGTMRIIDGVVANTMTGSAVDPGTILPSIQTLLDAIAEAEASIPLDYTNVIKSIRAIQQSIMTQALSFEQGGIDGDTGEFVPSTIQIRTGFIYIGKGNALNITVSDGYRAHVRWYTSNSASTFVSSRNSVSGTIEAAADYVAIVCTAPDWGTIIPSEGAHVTAKIYGAPESRYGIIKTAYILSSQPIKLDTDTWKLTLPGSSYYCRVITSFGEKFNINTLGEVQLSGSCVVYYKKDTNTIVTKDYTTPVEDPNLYLIGTINGIQVISMNILSNFVVNGVTSVGNTPEYAFFAGYRYTPAYISVLGDSISTYSGYSEGSYYPRSDVDTVNETWWAIVAKGLRAAVSDITVSAISQTAYIDQNNESLPPAYDDTRIQRLGSVHYPSYIFVNMGTNDPYLNNLGDLPYESDITALNSLPNSTTKGIALTIRKLQNAYADARIVLLIPKPVKISTVHGTASQYTEELVDKIADRIKTLGEFYGVYKVIDLRKCDMNQSNVASYCEDQAIHPNAIGMYRMGQYILHELLT